MRIYADDPGLDHTPLDTDFDDLAALFKDMEQFARDNRDHEFLCADDPGLGPVPRVPRLGWVAFLPGKDNPEDEQSKEWTITVKNAAKPLLADGSILRRALGSRAGRHQMIKSLVERARRI